MAHENSILKMKNSNKNIFLYYIYFICIFLIHLAMLLLPAINLEFTFADAARYFQTGDTPLINQYFRLQANTVGLPILASLVSTLIPNVDMLIVVRVLSIIGIIFLYLGVTNFCTFLKRDDTMKLVILILLNPLVWVFSSRGTADFLPAALGLFAISLMLQENKSIIKALLAGFILGLAAILKYHAIFLLLFLIPCLWYSENKSFQIKSFSIVSVISLSLLVIFLFFVHALFGFWVTPPVFQSIHRLNIEEFVNNFFLYAGYLVLICAPFSFIFFDLLKIFNKYKYRLFLFLVLLFFTGYLCFQDGGELNFGPLDRYINKHISAGLFFVLSVFILAPLFYQSKKPFLSDINKILTITLLLIIAVFSMTRPSQRYLLVVLPVFICLMPSRVISNKYVYVTSLTVYSLLNIFIGYSQWCTGNAAQKMVDSIQSSGLIKLTDPGAIEGHVGNQFYMNNRESFQYIVVTGEDKSAKIMVQSGISFIDKKFSLIEINKSINNN